MYILGTSGMGFTETFVNTTVGHDPACALIKDGRIIAIVEEERFNRIKHSPGYFPFNSIKYCLNFEGIDIDDVEHIVGSLNPSIVFQNKFIPERLYLKPKKAIETYLLWKIYAKKYKNNLKYLAMKLNKKENEASNILEKFSIVEHHLCHASSAYYLSGFKESSILTIDGSGENVSTLIGKGIENQIYKIKETYCPNSLGNYYSMFTEYLGFKPNNDEYKVMGLAPYGKSDECFKMDKLIRTHNGTFKINQRIFGDYRRYSTYIIKKFGKPRNKNDNLNERHKNIAFALQNKLEQEILKLVEWTVDKTGIKDLSYAGGVGMNTKVNGLILRSGLIDNIFVQPGAGDNGTAIGSALYKYYQLGGKKRYKLNHVYFGNGYSNDEIEKLLKIYRIKYETVNPSSMGAELIAKGKIIAWFQGRMEFGARALGNRSILADPTDINMKEKVNSAIKFRESFRPFCPSILSEKAEEYFENSYPNPFMTFTFIVKKEKRKEIPAVVHIDNTIRPQTVEKEINSKFYKLIKDFEKIKGVPLVLNTSFNTSREPIVRSPSDALRTFFSSGLDYLIIGDFLVRKS